MNATATFDLDECPINGRRLFLRVRVTWEWLDRCCVLCLLAVERAADIEEDREWVPGVEESKRLLSELGEDQLDWMENRIREQAEEEAGRGE